MLHTFDGEFGLAGISADAAGVRASVVRGGLVHHQPLPLAVDAQLNVLGELDLLVVEEPLDQRVTLWREVWCHCVAIPVKGTINSHGGPAKKSTPSFSEVLNTNMQQMNHF